MAAMPPTPPGVPPAQPPGTYSGAMPPAQYPQPPTGPPGGQYPQPYPGQYPAAYAGPPVRRRTAFMTLAQILVILEAVVGILFGIGAVAGGILLLTNTASLTSIPGFDNVFAGTSFLSAAAGVFIGVGVVTLVISVLWLWAGIALGRPSNAARWIVIILASLGALGYLASLLNASSTIHTNTGAYTLTLIILLAVQVIIVYALAIDPHTRHAYASR